MMTSLDDIESINRAYEAGATDFITNRQLGSFAASNSLHASCSRAFDELRKSEQNSSPLEAMPDMLFQMDKDGHCSRSKG